jgi:hypothetical protein
MKFDNPPEGMLVTVCDVSLASRMRSKFTLIKLEEDVGLHTLSVPSLSVQQVEDAVNSTVTSPYEFKVWCDSIIKVAKKLHPLSPYDLQFKRLSGAYYEFDKPLPEINSADMYPGMDPFFARKLRVFGPSVPGTDSSSMQNLDDVVSVLFDPHFPKTITAQSIMTFLSEPQFSNLNSARTALAAMGALPDRIEAFMAKFHVARMLFFLDLDKYQYSAGGAVAGFMDFSEDNVNRICKTEFTRSIMDLKAFGAMIAANAVVDYDIMIRQTYNYGNYITHDARPITYTRHEVLAKTFGAPRVKSLQSW